MLDKIIEKLQKRDAELKSIKTKYRRDLKKKTLDLSDIYYEIEPLPGLKLLLKTIAKNANTDPLKGLLDGVEIIDFLELRVSKGNFDEFKDFFTNLPESFVQNKSFQFSVDIDVLEEALVLNTQIDGYIAPPVPLEFYGFAKEKKYLKKQYEINVAVKSLVRKIADRKDIEKEELSTILKQIANESKLKGGLVELSYHLQEFSVWEHHPLKDLKVTQAGAVEFSGLLDAIVAIYKENAPETIVYSYKAEDLYPGHVVCFNAVSVNAFNYNDFGNFADLGQNHDGGTRAFLESIRGYDNPETTVFSVFVSDKPYEGSAKGLKPEMYVTAVTSTNAVFGTHMGIQRTNAPDLPYHKGLSVYLHKFAAAVITDFNPKVEYMITTPLGIMRTIIQKALYKNGELDSMSANMEELSQEASIRCKLYEIKMDDTSWEKYELSRDSVDRSYLKFFLKYQKERDIKFPATNFGVRKSKDMSENSEITLPEGSVVTITPEEKNGEYAWYFHNSNQTPGFDSPTIAVDYQVLAELGGTRFPIEKQVIGADGGAPADSEL